MVTPGMEPAEEARKLGADSASIVIADSQKKLPEFVYGLQKATADGLSSSRRIIEALAYIERA
ncbi:hypothetical protein GCM10023195_09470 [Actinoallomurus liliacearum]|uniref:Uncharacterized protein n=1 Tax=Actinoallomurus liliacearum TaxID=1080073 RepID=A0ABP8TCW6_9ACTN